MNEKTYDQNTLLVLFKNAPLAPHLHKHTWQVAFENSVNLGDDLFAYLLGDDGVWLSFSDRLADFEVHALTGYAISELEKRELTSSGVRVWGLRGDKPLLPIRPHHHLGQAHKADADMLTQSERQASLSNCR